MAGILGLLLGIGIGYLLWGRCKGAPPTVDENEQRRAAQRVREYRNFMTYNGYESEEFK